MVKKQKNRGRKLKGELLMSLKILATDQAPSAVGPYSQGIQGSNMIFTSGQIPVDLKTGEVCTGDIERETRLCLDSVKAVLAAGGASLEDVAKVTVFVTDIGDFSAINQVYAEYFTDHKPARSLVEVSKLPKGVNIEIEAIAIK